MRFTEIQGFGMFWHGGCIYFFPTGTRLLAGTTNTEIQMAAYTKILTAVGLVVTTLSTSAMADTYHHIDQLALKIARESKLILIETRHYRHTSEYKHLVSDARELYLLADHMHELAHRHGSLAHLESDLKELDSEFHHLESVFDRVERRASHRYGHGHIHGNTSHVKRLLNSVEDSIHHLQEDLRSLRTPSHSVPVVVVPRQPVHTTTHSGHWGGYNTIPNHGGYGNLDRHYGHDAYGRSSRGRGITFGGGSTRFTIRF